MNIKTEGNVRSTSNAYVTVMEDAELPITLMGGEKAMKEARQKYLPKEPMENDEQYELRIKRSTLKNYFGWAVDNHTGRIFNKPIVLSEDTPDIIKEYNKDLDLMGSNTNNFYRNVFIDTEIKGISYVYVDYPRTEADMSLAEAQDAGLRPYCIHIKAEQVIKAVPTMVNGRIVLGRAHVVEEVEVPEGKWNTKTIEQVRVLYPGYWELWRRNETGEWAIYDEDVTKLDYIPLVPLYGKRTGFFTGKSPLQDLANINRAHWQSYSDQMNITHVARVPILYGNGFNDNDEIKVGAGSMVQGPKDSKLEYVEHTGAAIDAGMNEVKDLEERMLLESLELTDNSTKTATGQALGVSDVNCSLQDLSLRLQDMITKVNNIMCDWESIDRAGSALVNTDFGLHMRDGSEANILLKMRQNRSISIDTFHREMKRRGLLSPDFNSASDIKLLDDEKASTPQPFVDENGKQIVGDENAEDLDTGKPRIE
jgi:hypothetical protein